MLNEVDFISNLESEFRSLSYGKNAAGLYRPISYTLDGGGKRLRPTLAAAACVAFGGTPESVLHQAMGIEMFHNFTLIHDDVMDRSSRRHGHATVYRRWGDEQAILSGDALLTLATIEVMKDAGDKVVQVLDVFNRMAIEVYEGQQLDTEFQRRKRVSIAQYMKMIYLKTAALISGACAIGAIMGGASQKDVEAMKKYGECLGMAFQLRDDWLDVYGDVSSFGKNIGNDIVTRKRTWLYIMAEENLPARLENAYESGYCNAKLVGVVRNIYDMLGLSAKCSALIDEYAQMAVDALPASLSDEDRNWFATKALALSNRIR